MKSLLATLMLSSLASAQLEDPFDRRYSPRRWQAAICLPDDPHKSIAGSDGALYYDFGRGPFERFACRVRPGVLGVELARAEQGLLDPRVPLVRTRLRGADTDLLVRAWAAAPRYRGVERWSERRHDYLWLALEGSGPLDPEHPLVVEIDPPCELVLDVSGTRLVEVGDPERVFCSFWPEPEAIGQLAPARRLTSPARVAVELGWARPARECHARMRDIVVGWDAPLRYRFAAEAGKRYRAAFALIEGYHEAAGVRPLELHGEGAAPRAVDPVAESGFAQPLVRTLAVADADGDGWIDLGVFAGERASDRNTILSALWIFDTAVELEEEALLSGALDARALAWLDARHPVEVPAVRLRFAGREALVALHRGAAARPRATAVGDAAAELARAERWWRALDLPYGRIQVPDAALQGLIDACIRNIYQARELRGGRPAFQVGPTHYRGMWAADGPFLLEAITYLGRASEARPGLELLAEGDEGPQGEAFSKKAGLRLWMILRHAQLTGDREWLSGLWPRVAEEVARIQGYRAKTRVDPAAVNYGLMPIGFGDGGLGGKHREYTNVYWNLAGLRAALEIAERLGREEELRSWRSEYADFWACFERARERDQLVDARGNRYVPVTMKGEAPQLPQRGAWAFMHAIYPGRVFPHDDALMRGTLAMLRANEREGLIHGTGWLPDGIWNYAGSFYAHALLWQGHRAAAARTLYAFANHACPLLCWREEQNLQDAAARYVGDMPHNWASAELIRLVRHLLVLERGAELHLLEGLPLRWARPGDETRLVAVPTSFGEIDLHLCVESGRALLEIEPPGREPCEIVVHLERFDRAVREVRLDGRPCAERPVRIQSRDPFVLELIFAR